jgi:hypothetical protein
MPTQLRSFHCPTSATRCHFVSDVMIWTILSRYSAYGAIRQTLREECRRRRLVPAKYYRVDHDAIG